MRPHALKSTKHLIIQVFVGKAKILVAAFSGRRLGDIGHLDSM